ncbi:MAG: hypothetical protein HQ596_04525 [Candidatus Saganbacteria bacterium]|nr:hypothetical protein [Candidatus Saganbacteria bacterium]
MSTYIEKRHDPSGKQRKNKIGKISSTVFGQVSGSKIWFVRREAKV